MSFLHRVARLGLGVRTSDIRREIGLGPLLLCVKRSQLKWFRNLAGMPPSFGGLQGTSTWEETPGQTQNPPEGRLERPAKPAATTS